MVKTHLPFIIIYYFKKIYLFFFNITKFHQGGSGYAKNIKFLNIVMHNVSNPIIIDQNYCDQETECQEQVNF